MSYNQSYVKSPLFSSIIFMLCTTGGMGKPVRSASMRRASSLMSVFTFILTCPLGGYKPALSMSAIVNCALVYGGTLSLCTISTALSNDAGSDWINLSLVRCMVLAKYSLTLSQFK